MTLGGDSACADVPEDWALRFVDLKRLSGRKTGVIPEKSFHDIKALKMTALTLQQLVLNYDQKNKIHPKKSIFTNI